ncbi:IclR family transcriptional regulator [Salinifilum ghardaiensis]
MVRTLETVDRALQLLQLFDRPDQQMSVSALATGLGIHRSSASRFAATLAERGFLERSENGEAFRLGPEVARLGMLVMPGRDLLRDAHPVMQSLTEQTGETVVLSVYDRGESLDVAQAGGAYLVGARQWLGRRSPLHASSDGKVFLAFAELDVDDALGPPVTGTTITDAAALRAEVEQVRQQGWAAARGELEQGLHGVAVPVRDHRGLCVAALSVSGPEYRIPESRLAGMAAEVQEAAGQLSARLGYSSTPVDR